MDKTLTVIYQGESGDVIEERVSLTGVPPSERLTPKLAVFASRAVCGHRDGVSVFDSGGYYYRLYKRSARKVYFRPFNLPTLKTSELTP